MAFRIGQFVTLAQEIGPWPEGTTAKIVPNKIKVQADKNSEFAYEHTDLTVEKTYLIVVLTKNPNNHIDSFTVTADEIKVAVLKEKTNDQSV